MKTFAAPLLAVYAKPVTQLCYCMKIVRTDGVVHAFTSVDTDVVVDSITYTKTPGVDVSNLAMTATLGVDNLETKVLPDDEAFLEVDLLAGRLNYADFTIFECDYSNPAAGSNILRRGWTGETTINRGVYTIEFRSLKQALLQQTIEVTSKTCRYRLGSTSYGNGGLCKVDLNAGSPSTWIRTYQVTAIDGTFPRRKFTCSSALEVDDFYTEGKCASEDGENEGYQQKIKHFAGGIFELSLNMPFAIFVGDTFTFTVGCQKRLDEDCRVKFNNVLNFGGEPHMPGPDLLTGDPVLSG